MKIPQPLFWLFFLASIALATSTRANVTGTGAQNFNSLTSGIDFVTVHSSETLKPGLLNLGMFWVFTGNSLPYQEDPNVGRVDYSDFLWSADLNLGLGLLENWDFGLSLPFVLNQAVDTSAGTVGSYAALGLTEIRFNTKYRMVGNDAWGIAVIFSTNLSTTANDPFMGDGASPIYNLEVAGDWRFRSLSLALNLGHRWRFPGDPIPNATVEPFENQFIASFAASYLFESIDTKMITEVFGSIPASGEVNENLKRSLSSAELLLGAKHDLNRRLSAHLGFGTELGQGLSSPDWRIYTGINYVLGPLWKTRPEPIQAKTLVLETQQESKQRVIVIENIEFQTDTTEMIGDYAQILSQLADQLRQREFIKVVVEGHTDSVGNAEYNQQLSQLRANAIRDYLVSNLNFPPRRVEAIGYGESIPIADNGNFQGRQKNRRVEFRVIYP